MQKNFVKKLDFCSYIFVGVFKVNDKNIRDLRIWIRTTPKCHGGNTSVADPNPDPSDPYVFWHKKNLGSYRFVNSF